MDYSVMKAGDPPNMQLPVRSCQGGIFVPVQEDSQMWAPPDALAMGTAFPCLYSPWEKGETLYE